ncbi:MAG TPA: hypothetical protein VIU34_22675 [Steroidobacter sp.]
MLVSCLHLELNGHALDMPFDLERARISARALSEKLRPIAETKVDVNDPHWAERMRQSTPLDELGIRAEAEALLATLLDAYASGTDTQRATVRDLFRTNSAFTWATHVIHPANTAEGFRMHLLSVSVHWGSEDPRDLMLGLKDIYETARGAGVNTQPIVSEIVALSENGLAELLLRLS